MCPLPRVCTPATSRSGDLGKQLRCCEPPFLCRWDVEAGGGGGLPAWLLAAAPGWRLGGWGVGEPRAGGCSLRAFSAPWRGISPVAINTAGSGSLGLRGGPAGESLLVQVESLKIGTLGRLDAPRSECSKHLSPSPLPPPASYRRRKHPLSCQENFH